MKDITHISELIPDDKNFNRHTERGSSLVKKSLERLGFGRSILIDKNKKIIAGNLTAEEAGQSGLEEVIIVPSDGTKIIAVQRTDIDLDTPKGRELALADNRTSEVSLNLDTQLIEEVFIDEPEIVEEYYFADELTVEELPEAKDAEPQTDRAEELLKKWGVVKGDLWQIGEHRLLCGDSTDSDAVNELMGGQRADISFTSPPYNVGRTPNGDKQKYLNDTDSRDSGDYLNLIESATKNMLLFSEFSFVNIQPLAGNKTALIEYQYNLRDCFCDYIIWDKMQAEPAMGENILNSQFEFVYVFGVSAKRRIGVKPFRGTLKNIVQIPSRSEKTFSDVHKATFPTHVPSHFIESFSEKSVLDLFLGSGTTMVAAQNLKRKCYGIEIEPKYCAVILERMSEAFPELEIKRIEKTTEIQR